MNEEKLDQSIPSYFCFCTASDCSAGGSCLRRQALENVEEDIEHLQIINPKLICPEAGEACPHYRSNEKVKYASGFTQAIQNVKAGNLGRVREEIAEFTSSRSYYRLRSGEIFMSPEIQKKVADILIACGAPEPIVFDHYKDMYNWS